MYKIINNLHLWIYYPIFIIIALLPVSLIFFIDDNRRTFDGFFDLENIAGILFYNAIFSLSSFFIFKILHKRLQNLFHSIFVSNIIGFILGIIIISLILIFAKSIS